MGTKLTKEEVAEYIAVIRKSKAGRIAKWQAIRLIRQATRKPMVERKIDEFINAGD